MFKKVIWIFILLVMTACTIVFSEQMDFKKKDATPAALEPYQPSDEIIAIGEAVDTATSKAAEFEFPLLGKASKDATASETKAPEAAADVQTKTLMKYGVQAGTPAYLANFNYLDKACAWQGVAGQVFGGDGVPVKYLIVKVFGTWNGEEVSKIAVTGMVAGKPYGKGSYEIELGDVAVDSTDPLYIQVFSSSGTPISDPFEFTTKAKCNRNLVLINFKKN